MDARKAWLIESTDGQGGRLECVTNDYFKAFPTWDRTTVGLPNKPISEGVYLTLDEFVQLRADLATVTAERDRYREALVKVAVELDIRLDEAAQMKVNNLCLSEVKHIALAALNPQGADK